MLAYIVYTGNKRLDQTAYFDTGSTSDWISYTSAAAKVKQVAELNIGILTQCVKVKTMSLMNPATCSNIQLKVNSKLNGVIVIVIYFEFQKIQ